MKYGKLYTRDLFFYTSHVRLHKNKTHAFAEKREMSAKEKYQSNK